MKYKVTFFEEGVFFNLHYRANSYQQLRNMLKLIKRKPFEILLVEGKPMTNNKTAQEKRSREIVQYISRNQKLRECKKKTKPSQPCYRCGECLWDTVSASPSYKSMTWECRYCKKQVTIRVVENTSSRSRSLSDNVRLTVWRRDNGACVICKSQENLEYDHVIPFSKGGSNTARNIRLLCEKCNRAKKDRI